MHTNKVINVVIPAYKPDDKLIRIFEMLKNQTVKVDRIVVMNTCLLDSSDEVNVLSKNRDYKIDTSFIEIHNIEKSEFDHGKTRNEGVSYTDSDCDFVVLMTQDAVPSDEKLIEELIKPFSDEKIGACYARQMPSENSSIAEVFTRGFNYPDRDSVKTKEDIEKIGIKAFFCSNVCAAYRMSVFKELGGFVNRAIFNEDMVYANKLLKSGYNIAYASKAKVIHTHDYSGRQQFKRNFDLAVSQKMNPQAFDGISSESEGVKYVKEAFKFFVKNKRPFAIIPFGINCVYKYLGYKKGRNFEKLSTKKLLKYSSNPEFFLKSQED